LDSTDKTQINGVTRIGKYDVIEVLGRGGMGVVYRAYDKQMGRDVAIKTLTQGFQGDAGMLARFYDEARRTGRLKHPNIVTVYDLGDDNGLPYIVMERVEGESLEKLIYSNTPLSMADRLRIVGEVCSALGYAHRNNVIHRDVKPANILVQTEDGTAKLLDFGIARLEKRGQDNRLTRKGDIIGTIPYMAPERIRNEELDGRSDIFAAGVVLYQLVTGQLPYTGEDYLLMQKILNDPYPPLSTFNREFSSALIQIVDHALAKAPDDRYHTADEMAVDLTSVVEEYRKEQALELLPEARRYADAQDFTRARAVLQQLVKIDSKHAEARQLLSEIHRHVSQRQREDKIQQIRQQAEGAVVQKQFSQALSMLEEGLQIDAANPELMQRRVYVKKEKDKLDRINEYLRQAEASRRKRDYTAAIASAKKALRVDKSNSKVIALCNQLSKEAEEAQKQVQARALLDSTRGELAARRYHEALKLLAQLEQLDPTHPELQLLLGDAKSGQEQDQRREAIAKLEEQVALATTYEQFQQAAQAIGEAITLMPAEAALFQLNAQVDRQIKEHENRRLVEDTLQACRGLGAGEALELVRNARLRIPGEERLLSMEAVLSERLKQQNLDQRRSDYLIQARQFLSAGNYAQAVQILQSCQTEGFANSEILSLLDFARREEADHRQQDILRRNVAQGQALIADEAYDAAIDFLETALSQTGDNALRLLLDQASAGRQALAQKVEAVLASAGKLVQAGSSVEASQFLEAQPSAILGTPSVQATIAALREDLQCSVFRTLGRAYAVLDSDLATGEAVVRRVAAASGNTSFASALTGAFLVRARTFADQVVSDITGRSRDMLRNNKKEAAAELLQSIARVVPYASQQAEAEWQRTLRKSSSSKLFPRPRGSGQ
jgi:serine/threonine-protein kinase